MGRHEEPVEPGPLFEFATDLRALRREAGAPPYRRLQRAARFSASTLADAASGKRLPTRDVTLAYVAACRGDVAGWRERWTLLAAHLRGTEPDLAAVAHRESSALVPDASQVVFAAATHPGRAAAGAHDRARPDAAPDDDDEAAPCADPDTPPTTIAPPTVAQITQRGEHAAALPARTQRASTTRRLQLGLAPLLLILATATIAALSTRNAPTHLDTTPPPINATPTPRPRPTATTPNTATTPGAGSRSTAAPTAADGGGRAATSPSATPTPGFTSTYRYSFENGTGGWGRAAGSDLSLTQSDTHAKDGSFSLAITDTAAQADAYVGAVISALPDGPAPGARVTAWIYVPATAGTVRAHLYTQDSGNWRQPTDTTIAPGSGWQQLSFTTPGNAATATSVGIQLNKSSTANITVYLDAITWG